MIKKLEDKLKLYLTLNGCDINSPKDKLQELFTVEKTCYRCRFRQRKNVTHQTKMIGTDKKYNIDFSNLKDFCVAWLDQDDESDYFCLVAVVGDGTERINE